MAFDVHRLDDVALFDDEESVADYDDELLDLFVASPEGQAFVQTHADIGFWAGRLLDYGRSYTKHLTEMDKGDVAELLTEIFPRKISLAEPEHADDSLPELIAFWEYLHREYKLPNAPGILAYLRSVKPAEFRAWMNDSARFGMAKSLFARGQAAGFDMATEEGNTAFMNYYNNNLARPLNPGITPDMLSLLASSLGREGLGTGSQSKKDAAKARHKRQIARASRKKNRKRR